MKRLLSLLLLLPAAVAHAQMPAPSAPPELRPIIPPVPVPMPLWQIVALSLAAAAVFALVVWLIVKLARRKTLAPPLLPREIALRDLRALRQQQNTLEPLPFSVAVSDILRTYIAAQFGLHAREQTSQEFLAAISGTPHFTSSERQFLAAFLEKCDLIKFARQDATSQDSDELWTQAEAFVKGGAA